MAINDMNNIYASFYALLTTKYCCSCIKTAGNAEEINSSTFSLLAKDNMYAKDYLEMLDKFPDVTTYYSNTMGYYCVIDYNRLQRVEMCIRDRLLVDSNVHENYELIKLLTENESLNELKTKIQLNLEDFRVKESDLRFQSLELQNLLNNTEYKDVNKIKARIDRSKMLLEIMETLDQVDFLYNKIQDNWVEHLNYKELLKQLELLEVLANAITLAKSITFREEVKKEQIETIDWAISFGSALTKFKPVQQVDYEEVGREIDSMTFLRDYLNALKSVKVVDKASLKKTASEYNTMHALESLFSLSLIHI